MQVDFKFIGDWTLLLGRWGEVGEAGEEEEGGTGVGM